MGKTHAERIREAVTDLGLSKPREIMNWIKRHYPNSKVNPQSYRADIIGCSVNHSSQHHYPNMPKFLWFEKDTKKYRLAKPEEMPEAPITRNSISSKSEKGVTFINGIPLSKLSVTGQVLIPSNIREKMGFETGDKLAFIINENGKLEIRKARIKLDLT